MKMLCAVRGIFPDYVGGSHRHSREFIQSLSHQYGIEIDVIHPGPNLHFEKSRNVREDVVEYGGSILDYSRNIDRFLCTSGRMYDVAYADGLTLSCYLKHKQYPCVFNHHGYHFAQPHFLLEQFFHEPVHAIQSRIADYVRAWMAGYNVKRSDYVISLSPIIARILRDRYHCEASKIIHTSGAVTLSERHSRRQRVKVKNALLFVGTLEYRKGLIQLLKAFRSVDGPAKLYIIGDGPLRSKLIRLAQDAQVTFVGRVNDDQLHEWYRKVDGFVFSGLAEAGPLVVLEAMSHGLPIISTDVGNVRAMIDGNGWLVPPGDIKQMARAIQAFTHTDEPTKTMMGRRSRELIEDRFTWSKITEDFVSQLQYRLGVS